MDDWNTRANAIFLEAIEKPSAAHLQTYLDAACGDDGDLRREVESLLQAHERAGAFLGSPAPDSPTDLVDAAATTHDTPAAVDGTLVAGRYRLLEPIGEGGMGTVWLAEQQEPVRRKVAVKLIKPGMDSQAVIARFEAERQALALMDHPNIAKVFDAGTSAEGRPFFVMELVKGVPLTTYCDEKR